MKLDRNVICAKLSEFISTIKDEKDNKIVLTENTHLIDCSINSLQFVQLIILIETEFEIEIPDEYLLMTEMDTIAKIIDIIISCTN